MDAFKAQLLKIQQQLSGLSASQKMLTASLVAIMVLTIMMWAKYAGTSEMEPVLNQPFPAADIPNITSQLTNRGINFRVEGDLIYVPVDRKVEAISVVSMSSTLNSNTRGSFDEIINRMTTWDSQERNDMFYTNAKQAYLSQIIRYYPGVEHADVLLDTKSDRKIGSGGYGPSASISITMTKGQPIERIGEAAANLVSGAIAGLKTDAIKVTINGSPYKTRSSDPESLAGGEFLAQKNLAAQSFTKTMQEYFDKLYPGAFVTVSCDVENSSRRIEKTVYDKDNIAKAETKIDNESTEETTGGAPTGEPGAVPNAVANGSMSVGSSGGNNTSSTHTKESTAIQPMFSSTKTQETQGTGKVIATGAAVRIPKSYFVGIWKDNGRGASAQAEPTSQDLAQIIQDELPILRKEVHAICGEIPDQNISVQWYIDKLPAIAAPPATPTGTASMTAMMTGHVKEIAIGALAVISLFMVSTMVRKSGIGPAIAASVQTMGEPQTLPGMEAVAGFAGGDQGALDGMELDEDSIRSQQMVEQVSTMVKDNPDAAANLVNRWLSRD